MRSGAQPLPSNGEAFGYQGGIRVKCDDHGGAEGLRQEHVLALGIPGDRCDVGPQISGAGERLMPQCRQGCTALREDIALCKMECWGGVALAHTLSLRLSALSQWRE